MTFGIHIRPADTLCSRYLRKLRGQCEKCGRKGIGKEGIEGLQASHFFGRRHESTRFNPLNIDILCFFCHQHFEENPREYDKWKEARIGKKAMKDLELEANRYQKKDDKLVLIYFKEKLKELK